jgi:hypothetical protein
MAVRGLGSAEATVQVRAHREVSVGNTDDAGEVEVELEASGVSEG